MYWYKLWNIKYAFIRSKLSCYWNINLLTQKKNKNSNSIFYALRFQIKNEFQKNCRMLVCMFVIVYYLVQLKSSTYARIYRSCL